MATLRKPFQGVKNVVRFNWHFYVLALVVSVAAIYFSILCSGVFSQIFLILSVAIITTTILNLCITYYVYDVSDLYKMRWLQDLFPFKNKEIVTLNAGFDETTLLISEILAPKKLHVLDFYDPKTHTEISIKRAQKAFPSQPETIKIKTQKIPLLDNSVEIVFAILAAHEIRSSKERTLFFSEINRILDSNGTFVVVEHLRDFPNFVAYTLGFFHFLSKKSWLRTFASSNFYVTKQIKITPFITAFILQKNAITH